MESYLGLEQFWAVCVVWGALVVTALGQTWAARTELAGNLAALPRPQTGAHLGKSGRCEEAGARFEWPTFHGKGAVLGGVE